MARAKKTVISNVSFEKAQEASSEYTKADNKLSKIESKMNERINKIKEEYVEETTQLSEEKERQFAVLEVYATEQQEKWGDKKSFELLHTTIGFRTGTPKVEKDKKFTWEAVLKLVKKHKALAAKFLRTKEELNKKNILAEKDDKVLAKLKNGCFIYIDQVETFYVEPKVEELQTT